MNQDWSKAEVIAIVKDYFNMLQSELDNQDYNKSEHRRILQPKLNDRSDGSVEFKHQNISAVLANLGQPYIKGYKPRGNYQELLEDEVSKFLEEHRKKFEPKFDHFANGYSILSKTKADFKTIISAEPEQSEFRESEPSYLPIKINYLEREQNNRNLGEEGEKLVIEYERWRLIEAGKNNFADKIEWVSKGKGDGLGYDILSKNNNGTDRYIEVKTTKLSKETPIYISRTEWKFSSKNSTNFFLYRVFNFVEKPQFFIKQGNYESFCHLQSQSFKGFF
ncbi:MAG TPA: DUF3883 domain-containing protein [Puia sp.]|nr:DUF3883 domain-containing protein [Puia sp.]